MRKVRSLLNLDLDLSLRHPLRPCLGQGASLGEEAVSADSGRAGEVTARVGWVRSLAFLSTLPRYTPVIPDVQSNDISAYPQSFSVAC